MLVHFCTLVTAPYLSHLFKFFCPSSPQAEGRWGLPDWKRPATCCSIPAHSWHHQSSKGKKNLLQDITHFIHIWFIFSLQYGFSETVTKPIIPLPSQNSQHCHTGLLPFMLALFSKIKLHLAPTKCCEKYNLYFEKFDKSLVSKTGPLFCILEM